MADFDVNISDGTSIEVVVIPSSGAGAGVSDHGELTGLADDDHSQYHNDARGDVRYYQKSEVYTKTEGDGRYAPLSHVGSGGTAHANAVASGAAGFLAGSDKSKLDAIESGATADQNAAEVAFAAAGGIVATNVQAALQELDTEAEKVANKDQNNGYAGLNASGRVPIARLASGAPDGTKFVRDDGVLAVPGGGTTPEAMHVLGTGGEPTLQNSWVTFGTSSPGFYKHEERVYLQGMISSGTAGANTILFTLPAGYRPAASQFFTTTSRSGASTYVTGNIEVTTGGDVLIKTGGNNNLALNGVNFRV